MIRLAKFRRHSVAGGFVVLVAVISYCFVVKALGPSLTFDRIEVERSSRPVRALLIGLVPKPGAYSAASPIHVDLVFTNQSQKQLFLEYGNREPHNLYVIVRDAKGNILDLTPAGREKFASHIVEKSVFPWNPEGKKGFATLSGSTYSGRSIASGKSTSFELPLSDYYRFEGPGTYSVEAAVALMGNKETLVATLPKLVVM